MRFQWRTHRSGRPPNDARADATTARGSRTMTTTGDAGNRRSTSGRFSTLGVFVSGRWSGRAPLAPARRPRKAAIPAPTDSRSSSAVGSTRSGGMFQRRRSRSL